MLWNYVCDNIEMIINYKRMMIKSKKSYLNDDWWDSNDKIVQIYFFKNIAILTN